MTTPAAGASNVSLHTFKYYFPSLILLLRPIIMFQSTEYLIFFQFSQNFVDARCAWFHHGTLRGQLPDPGPEVSPRLKHFPQYFNF